MRLFSVSTSTVPGKMRLLAIWESPRLNISGENHFHTASLSVYRLYPMHLAATCPVHSNYLSSVVSTTTLQSLFHLTEPLVVWRVGMTTVVFQSYEPVFRTSLRQTVGCVGFNIK